VNELMNEEGKRGKSQGRKREMGKEGGMAKE
jgi:hypothetical protein